MGLLQAAAAAIALYALLQLLVLPKLRRRLKSAQPRSAAALVGSVLLAEVARGASLVIALSLVLIVAAIWSVPLLFAYGSQAQLGAAFDFLRTVREQAESLESWWGVATIAVFAVALRVALGREAERQAKKAAATAFERLNAEAEAGTLPELPPTSEMMGIAKAIEERCGRAMAIIEAAQGENGDPAKADPESNAELAQLLREMDQLREEHTGLDIARRLDVAAPLAELGRPAETRVGRFGSLILSAGFIRSLSFGARALSITSLALLAPSLVAVASSAISDASLEAGVRVHDIILRNTIKEAEESWHRALGRNAEERQLSDADNALIDQLAHQFQQYLQTQNGLAFHASFDTGHIVGQTLARERILTEFAARRPGTVSASGVTDKGRDEPVMKAVLAAEPPNSLAPSTVREQFRAELAQEARHATSGSWGAFEAKARQALNSARVPLASADIAERLFTEAVNSIGSITLQPSADAPAFHLLAANVVEPGDLTERYAEVLKLDRLRFLNNILQTGAIATPPTELVAERGIKLHDDEIRAQAESVVRKIDRRLASAADPWRHQPPSLALIANETRDLDAAKTQLADMVGKGLPSQVEQNLPNALAGYSDYFPAHYGEETRTPRFALMESIPAFKREIDRRPIAASENFLRARHYGALRGFAKIGGVLIGLEPTPSSEAPQIVGLEWTLGARGLQLILERDDGKRLSFGPFRAEIIQLALAYAADGRPVAATMPTAGPYGRQVLLHPALVDTALGCEARHLDQFVDAFTGGAVPRELATERVDRHRLTYAFGWAAQIKRLAPEFAEHAAEHDRDYAKRLISEASEILGSKVVNEAVEATLAESEMWNDPRLSPVTVKRDYFDQKLARTIGACLAQMRSPTELQRCVATTELDRDYLASETWLARPPSFFSESGVRETPYELDRDLTFLDLSRQRDDPVWPFDFMLQVTFETPRYFAHDRQEVSFDEAPFEYPAIHDWIHTQVANGIRKNGALGLDARRALSDLREFAVLQRFFRVALKGSLGTQFPLDTLVSLGRVEPRTPPTPVHTLRWNSPIRVVEAFKEKPMGAPLASLGVVSDAQQLIREGDSCPAIEP